MPRISQEKLYANGAFPASDWEAVTPSDVTNFTNLPQALYIGVAGDISLTSFDGNTVVFTVGTGILDVSPLRVNATDTTADNIVALYQALR